MFPFRNMLPPEPVIFQEKLRCPDIHGLLRGRLSDRLSGPASESVGCVCGPAGSGKTTLLGQLATSTDVTSAWYSASAEDASEAALVSHLALALGEAMSDRDIVLGARSSNIDALVTALEEGPLRPLLLIVDDLHEVAGSSAERALARFLALKPRHLRVVLGSRLPPLAINTPRLLVSGELVQVDADDLRFRTWEVEELFRVVYAQPLSPETAAALTRRTGGWAAGLQLFHLATRDLTRSELDRSVEELNGRSRLIRSYLARNVLDGVDAARRSFLLKTSTLSVLSGDMCDALLRCSGSAAMLHDLEREQFFTTSVDGGVTYRYHCVLQTHLEVSLGDEIGTAAERQLYARSAEILERAGYLSAALRAHARAEDWGSVARLFQQAPFAVPCDEPTLAAGVERLGCDDPWIVLANARRMLRCGRVVEAVSRFRSAEALLEDPDFRRRCATERAVAEDWLPTASDVTTSSSDPRLRCSQGLRRATRNVEDVDTSGYVGLVGGTARLLAGDTVGAAAELRRALHEPGLDAWERLAIRLVLHLVELAHPSDPAVGLLEEIVLAADLESLPWLSRVARGLQYAVLSRANPKASTWVVTGRDLVEGCRREDDLWASCVLALALGAACLLDDDPAGDPLLATAAATASELDAPVLQAWADSLRAVGALRGQVPGAAGLVDAATTRAQQLGIDIGPLRSRIAGLPPADPRPLGPAPVERASCVEPTRLTCLGSFALLAGGRKVDWHALRPRAQTLLMFLAMRHGHDVHRETLIDALWPAAELSSGIRSLQVAVSSIRQCLSVAGLPDGSLQRRWDSYALILPKAFVQLEQFERSTRRGAELERAGESAGALESHLRAVELYAGDLLPEVGPADWVVHERERLRCVAAGASADAARLALRLGELSVVVRAAQRSIELDPYHDRPWNLLAEGFERIGDHSAAAVTRRDHERACAELGI